MPGIGQQDAAYLVTGVFGRMEEGVVKGKDFSLAPIMTAQADQLQIAPRWDLQGQVDHQARIGHSIVGLDAGVGPQNRKAGLR